MSSRDYYKSGSWNAICEMCGFKRKSDQMVENWKGQMVCKPSVKAGCWETRHPQEMIRPPKGEAKLPWTRPEGVDVAWHDRTGYNDVSNQCSIMGYYCQADYMEADCAECEMIDGSLIDGTTDLSH